MLYRLSAMSTRKDEHLDHTQACIRHTSKYQYPHQRSDTLQASYNKHWPTVALDQYGLCLIKHIHAQIGISSPKKTYPKQLCHRPTVAFGPCGLRPRIMSLLQPTACAASIQEKVSSSLKKAYPSAKEGIFKDITSSSTLVKVTV